MVGRALLALAALVAGTALVLWIGAATSLDRELRHSRAAAALPGFAPSAELALVQIAAGGQRFRARVAGFGGARGNLVLLHGFPETSAMWIPLVRAAAASGYQVVAFDQRGYSPGARPEGPAAYTFDALVGDVFEVADAVGFERFHLVGHDWGAAVGWMLVLRQPERVRSWTALSIPHLRAFASAVRTDPVQRRRSSYVAVFRLPWLPEQLFAFADFGLLRRAMYRHHAPEAVDEYLAVFAEPGALTAALDWYRAPEPFGFEVTEPEVSLPVLTVWGNRDPAVGRAGVEGQGQYMTGPFRHLELDTGHWLMETETEAVVEAVLEHLAGA